MRWLQRLLRLGLGPEEPLSPRPPGAGVTYGELTDLPDGAVIGAGFAPGFDPDLTCWRVWVFPDGRVRQEILSVTQDTAYRPEERAEERQVAPAAAAALHAAALAGLAGSAGRHESDATDQPRISVAARSPDGVWSAVVYGPWDLADRGHPAAAAVLGVWRSVQRHAPWQPPWLRTAAEPGAAADPRWRTWWPWPGASRTTGRSTGCRSSPMP